MMDAIDIVINITIAGFVGMAILFYQRRLGRKVDKLIIKQNQIIDEGYKREGSWKEVWGGKDHRRS